MEPTQVQPHFGSAEHGFLQGRSSHPPPASYAISLRAPRLDAKSMMFAAQLSVDDIAILEEAIDRALSLAAERGLEIAPGQLAAQLCEAFWNGERNPVRLAEAVIGPPILLH
jgi:hypothetical protein